MDHQRYFERLLLDGCLETAKEYFDEYRDDIRLKKQQILNFISDFQHLLTPESRADIIGNFLDVIEMQEEDEKISDESEKEEPDNQSDTNSTVSNGAEEGVMVIRALGEGSASCWNVESSASWSN